jgi:hypothetical protein
MEQNARAPVAQFKDLSPSHVHIGRQHCVEFRPGSG